MYSRKPLVLFSVMAVLMILTAAFTGLTVSADSVAGENAATVTDTTSSVTDTAPAAEPVSISAAKIKVSSGNVYTGKAIKPDVTVKLSGVTLTKGTDYKVKYSNNKNVGAATVTVTGIGNYTGTAAATFKINPKAVTVKSVKNSDICTMTVKWSKNSKATGYQILYTKSGTSKKITIRNSSTVSKDITGLLQGKNILSRSELTQLLTEINTIPSGQPPNPSL